MVKDPDSTSGNATWTNAAKRTALTMAQRAVATQIGGIRKRTTIACVAKQVQYTVASDCFAVTGLWFVKDWNWNKVVWNPTGDFPAGRDTTIDKTAQQLLIYEYTFTDSLIRIFPALANYTFDSLIVEYLGLPGDIDSNTQVIQMPAYSWLSIYKVAEWILKNPDLTVGEENGVLVNIDMVAKMFVQRYAVKERNQ